MMLRKGFTVLEIVFGLLISSMIALILFQSLTQTNGILGRVTALTSLERRVMLLQQQFEADFSGIFAPQLIERDDEEEEEKGEKEKEPAPKKEEKKKKEGELQEEQSTGFKTFTFESDERGLVKILSFVTTNPLSVYQQPSPRAVRVAYRVIPDPENEGKLLLVRQESAEELSLKKFEQATNKATIKTGQVPIRSYEIARDIENIKFEFFVEKRQKPEPEKKQGESEKPADKKDEKKEEEKPRVYFTLDEWKRLSEDEKKKYEKPEIPSYCTLKLFINDDRKKVHSFEFLFVSCAGIAPVTVQGATSLPSAHEIEQRKAGQAETDRMALHGGIPQYGRGR